MSPSHAHPPAKPGKPGIGKATAHAGHGIDRAAHLARAETLCADAGETFTPLRRRVLELLLDAGGPAKAYDLLDGLKSEAGAAAKPPTIYRALEFLTRLGLAHRVESLNAFVACEVGACARATIFLICDTCNGAEEFDAGHALVDVAEAAARDGFTIERTMIEAHGRCAKCSAAA
ncbi:MAG: Fur family transcriptional regulator, zinc uptake regulator [Alphaproteobacteria bacterium]|nr:MAG: Fur family transcriptional regulator zinc uptake regulator [Caulobacteraceae bacterium]TPW05597.1 MAG: Fur family transcriptional regulator, zinc uptake regulator [Alphaproteobacteria bacterium]